MTEEKKLGPLARLSEDDIKALLGCARQRSFKADEVILEQDRLNSTLFIVMKGLLHVRRYAKGRQVLLGRLGPGSFFGDMSIFDPGPTSAAVVATAEGQLIEITSADLERFKGVRPAAAAELLTGLLELMAQRLRRTDERLVEAIFWGGLLKDQ